VTRKESLKVTLRAPKFVDPRSRAVLEDRIDQLEKAWTERHGHGAEKERP
jgi:hypothetical protein